MKSNDNLQEIKKTLEGIRVDQFSDVPKEIIEEIVDIQFMNQEQERRVTGRASTQQAIRRFIDKNSGGGVEC